MNSLCCVNCFNDKAIKSIITSYQQFGRCHYCNDTDVSIISIDNLLSDITQTLEGLSMMFEEDNEADKLIDILDKDFEVFSQNTNSCRLKNDFSTKLPDIFNRKYKSVDIAETHKQWIDFKTEIIHKNRFFPQTTIYQQAFLPTGSLYNSFQQLIEQLSYPIHSAEFFFRGRISNHPLDHGEMGKPPPNLATLGRANPYGISYLYLAQTSDICIKEIRPNNGDTISIAKFRVTRQLQVIDLRRPREKISFLSLGSSSYIDILKLVNLLETFANELSLPVLPNNSQREYIPTQFITEFFKTHGNKDGLIFNSSYGTGYNLVLFDDIFCTCDQTHNVEFVRIKGINFEHGPV